MRRIGAPGLYFLLAFALFVALVAVPDLGSDGEAWVLTGLVGFALASVAFGFAIGRWWACACAGLAWLAAFATDLLWYAEVIDRSHEREPLPVSFLLLVGVPWLVPAIAALIALGVAARRSSHRTPRGAGRERPA
jgi:uncharacterized membrane protein